MGNGTQERVKGALRIMVRGKLRITVVPEALRATRRDWIRP